MFEELANFGAFLLFFVNVPQLVRAVKNRNDLKDISLLTQFLYLFVGILYGLYGYANGLHMLWMYNVYGTFHFCTMSFLILRSNKKRGKIQGEI